MTSYKDFAVSLAFRAGDIMKQNFTVGMLKKWKKDNTPLTATDLAINSLVMTEVHNNFPDHGIIAEEGSDFNGEEYTWVCDPVDGTIPFSHGYPLFTFSFALVKNGHPILGLLYDPVLSRMVIAQIGLGAYINGKKIKVSLASNFSRSLFSLDSNQPLPKLRQELKQAGCIITTFACLTYSSMLVAIGEFAGVIWGGKTPWDGAAVQIIIEEAGGICTDINGQPQRYDREINGIVASNRELHPQLMKMIEQSNERL